MLSPASARLPPAACRLCLTRMRAGVGTEALAQEDTSAGDVVSSHLAGEAETAAVVALADLSPSMGAPPLRACPQRARLQLNLLRGRDHDGAGAHGGARRNRHLHRDPV